MTSYKPEEEQRMLREVASYFVNAVAGMSAEEAAAYTARVIQDHDVVNAVYPTPDGRMDMHLIKGQRVKREFVANPQRLSAADKITPTSVGVQTRGKSYAFIACPDLASAEAMAAHFGDDMTPSNN